MDRLHAMRLLLACRGDEIWPLDHCRQWEIPESWIAELSDCHESGFRYQMQEIWTDHGLVNQFHGIADIRLAIRAAEILGIDVDSVSRTSRTPSELVRRLQSELDEMG